MNFRVTRENVLRVVTAARLDIAVAISTCFGFIIDVRVLGFSSRPAFACGTWRDKVVPALFDLIMQFLADEFVGPVAFPWIPAVFFTVLDDSGAAFKAGVAKVAISGDVSMTEPVPAVTTLLRADVSLAGTVRCTVFAISIQVISGFDRDFILTTRPE